MSHKYSVDENNTVRDPPMGVPGVDPDGMEIGPVIRAKAEPVPSPVRTAMDTPMSAVVGGTACNRVSGVINPAREHTYWRENYSKRPYVEREATYEDYGPAYGFGIDAVTRYPGRAFDEIEPEMSLDWPMGGGTSMLGWSNARHAARDAWHRANGHDTSNK